MQDLARLLADGGVGAGALPPGERAQGAARRARCRTAASIRAAQTESRPKRVRNHGEPAAAKTSVGSSGSVSSRCRRSTSDRCTVAARRESCEVTRTESQCTRAAPGPASKGVSATRRALTSTTRVTDPPGGIVSGQRALSADGVAVTVLPRATRVVACRASAQPPRSGPSATGASTGPAPSPVFTVCSSAPSPCASRPTTQRTSRPAREETVSSSVIPVSCSTRCRRTSTVGSGPGSPTLRASSRHSVEGPAVAATTGTGATPSTVSVSRSSTRRSSTNRPVAAPGSAPASTSPERCERQVTLPCTATSSSCSHGWRDRGCGGSGASVIAVPPADGIRGGGVDTAM